MTDVEWGRVLAENWADWVARDGHDLGYPTRTTIVRLIESCRVHDDADERLHNVQAKAPVDEILAEQTERCIVGMARSHKDILLSFYCGRDRFGFYRRLQVERPLLFSRALDDSLCALARAQKTVDRPLAVAR